MPRHTRAVLLLVMVAGLLLVSACSGDTPSVNVAPDPSESVSPEAAPKESGGDPTPEQIQAEADESSTTHAWGEAAEVDGLRITPDPAGIVIGEESFMDDAKTEFNARWDKVEFLLENVSDEPFPFIGTGFALRDADFFTYYADGFMDNRRQLPMEASIPPGGKLRGYIQFRMQQGAAPTTLIYWGAEGAEVRWE